jgi:hypothetical protein
LKNSQLEKVNALIAKKLYFLGQDLLIEKELQRQWDLYNDYKEFQSLRKDKDFLSVVKSLTSQFGEKPSFDDVKWRIFNNYSRDYAMERQWGLFRNNRMYMADFLLKKGKLENALIHYLEVLYLDINGPRNVSIESEQLLNYKEKDFIPRENSSALYMISNINNIKEDLKFTKEQIKEYFFNVNNSDRPIPQMPISVNDAWNMTENIIT